MPAIVRDVQTLASSLTASVVTIGNFDGVHQGHREILRLVRAKAEARGCEAVAMTFHPHPQGVLRPGSAPPLLTGREERLELLLAAGMDRVVEQPFTAALSETTAEEFFRGVVQGKLGARAIVVGHDFAFGRRREGHRAELTAWCEAAGIELTIVPPQAIDGVIVSSSRIREALAAGDVALAARLLGRWFEYRGSVVHGDARGGRIGFPTLNLAAEEGKVRLPYGVYATRVTVEGVGADGQDLPGVTNFGVRPTFTAGGAPAPSVETHVLDLRGLAPDLYGRAIRVSFVDRIREERRFSGVDELRAQIARDVEAARARLRD